MLVTHQLTRSTIGPTGDRKRPRPLVEAALELLWSATVPAKAVEFSQRGGQFGGG